MDIRTFVMDGKARTSEWRGTFEDNLPVNGHTAAVLMGNRDDLLMLTMNDYLLKPIVLDELIAVISAAIQWQQRSE